jgi:hypothetical protein
LALPSYGSRRRRCQWARRPRSPGPRHRL